MKKIVSFPPPFPDEDYRNLVFRHQIQTPYESLFHAREELFGRLVRDMMIYPENLNRLDEHLGVGHNFLVEIINEHTFYPFLRPFLNEEQIHQCQRALFHHGYVNNPLIRGRMRSYISNSGKYCPSCLHDDLKKYGISYMHRIHQFNFLTHCHLHGDRLLHACPICGVSLMNHAGSQMLTTPYCIEGHEIMGTQDHREQLFQRQLVNEFVDLTGINVSLDTIYQRLVVSTGNRGYIHFKGDFIYKNKLVTDLIEHYSKVKLRSIGIDSEQLLSVKFLTHMFQEKSIQGNIIFYILLMCYFGGSVKDFFSLDDSYSISLPFGTGPWRCMNYICPDYYKKVIHQCSRKVHEWVTGTFTCPTCGMIYTRCGLPKEEDESQYSIETMGPLFIETAVKYYEEGYLIQEIAEFMHSNKTTVRKYLRPFRDKVHRERKNVDIQTARKVIELGFREAAASAEPKIEQCIQTVLDAIAYLGDNASRPMIRKYNIHRYDWLMKYERDWMESVLPPRKVMDKVLNRETMDEELSKMVATAVQKCWGNPPENIIGIKTIFKLLPSEMYSRYSKHKNILPKTTQAIQAGLETQDQYAIRKLPKVIEWFDKSRYKTLSLRLIQCKYHFYKKLQPETLQYIQNEINKYSAHDRNDN